MADEIRLNIRAIFGEDSAQEWVFNSLLNGLKPSDRKFSPGFARKLVPERLVDDLDEVLVWFSLGPLHILEMRFSVYGKYDGEHEVSGAVGLRAYLDGRYVEPTSGYVIEGPEVGRRLFPHFRLTSTFLSALSERGSAR